MMIDARCISLSVVMVLLQGAGWVVAKYALDEFPPVLLVAFRFGVAAVVLVWFTRPPSGQMREIVLVSTLVVVIPYSMFYTGMLSLDVSIAVVLGQLDAPVVIILGAIFLKERPGYRKIFGTAIALLGTYIIMESPNLSGQYVGAVLIVFGVVVWGVGQVRIRKMKNVDAFTLVVWNAVFATPQLLLVSAIFEQDQVLFIQEAAWGTWISIVSLGLIITPVSVGIWYSLVRKYSFANVAPFTLLVPAVSVVGGVAFLGEQLTLHFVIGALIVLIGIGSILVKPRRKHLAGHRKASAI